MERDWVQREEKTIEELQELIQDNLNALQNTLNSSEKITAPLVYRHAPDESAILLRFAIR